MRFLLVLIMLAFAGCSGSAEDPAPAAEMHTAADELQESINSSMQKAQDVEVQLQDAADDLDAAIDDASGDR